MWDCIIKEEGKVGFWYIGLLKLGGIMYTKFLVYCWVYSRYLEYNIGIYIIDLYLVFIGIKVENYVFKLGKVRL